METNDFGVNTLLHQWYESPWGQYGYYLEATLLSQIWPKYMGQYAVQLGGSTNPEWWTNLSLAKKIVVQDTIDLPVRNPDFICAHFNELPFSKNSLDLIFVPHLFDLVGKIDYFIPYFETLLTNRGGLVIMGFNPIGLGRLQQVLASSESDLKQALAWIKHWYSPNKVCTILEANEFRVESAYLIGHGGWAVGSDNHNRLSDIMGALIWPFAGTIYVIEAQKKIATLTPVRARAIEIAAALV